MGITPTIKVEWIRERVGTRARVKVEVGVDVGVGVRYSGRLGYDVDEGNG